MNNCLSSRFEFFLDYKTPYDLNEVHNFYVRNMVLNVIVNTVKVIIFLKKILESQCGIFLFN